MNYTAWICKEKKHSHSEKATLPWMEAAIIPHSWVRPYMLGPNKCLFIAISKFLISMISYWKKSNSKNLVSVTQKFHLKISFLKIHWWLYRGLLHNLRPTPSPLSLKLKQPTTMGKKGNVKVFVLQINFFLEARHMNVCLCLYTHLCVYTIINLEKWHSIKSLDLQNNLWLIISLPFINYIWWTFLVFCLFVHFYLYLKS